MKEANIKVNESNLGHLIDSIERNLRPHNKEKESNWNALDKSKVKNNLIKSQEFIVETKQKEITVSWCNSNNFESGTKHQCFNMLIEEGSNSLSQLMFESLQMLLYQLS